MDCFKQQFHKWIPALLLFLSFLFLIGTTAKDSAFCAASELFLLWENPLAPEETDTPSSNLAFTDSPDATPYFNAQWALHNTGEYIYYVSDIAIQRSATPDIDINLPEAYEQLLSRPATRPVTVAVIDTGIDITHPALRDHIFTNENEIPDNGIDDDGNGYIDDVHGWDFYHNDNTVCHYTVSEFGDINADPADNDNHGTHCAGIIAATEGILGVASGIDIRILPIKIHGGEKNTGSVSDAVKAIKYAQSMGADICNLSWGTFLYSEALESVMQESDMLFVVAAGNTGSNNNSSPLYPASYELDNMISVAYVTQSGKLANDSNYGVFTVDIAAPGQDIYSTTVGGTYHYLSGSSMAAPIVSGISALLYAYGESPYPQNIKELLLQTLKPLDSLIGYVRYPGIPDSARALAAADTLASDTIPPTLRATTQYNETELVVLLDFEDLGGSGLRTLRYAFGQHDVSYFRHGVIGQQITGSSLSLGKAGTYTFYLSDYAGNETVYVHTVQDDVTPPVLSATYKENADGTFTVTVSATDIGSGIKRLRYLEGIHPETLFLAMGHELSPDSGYSFIATADTEYTLHAADYRGNKVTYTLRVEKIPAQQIFLNTLERTLQPGDRFTLVPLVLPFTATDYISYAVSDETLLYADSDGTLTALAPGTVTVIVSTSGGVTKTCTIHIVAPSLSELQELPIFLEDT